jgi:tetratricopeptide (TPR) repeat protein
VRLLLESGNPAAASATLDHARSMVSASPDLLDVEASILLSKGKTAEAVATLKQAQALKPACGRLYRMATIVEASGEEHGSLIAEFERQAEPEKCPREWIAFLAGRGRVAEALAFVNERLKTRRDAATLLDHAALLQAAGKKEEAGRIHAEVRAIGYRGALLPALAAAGGK